MPTFVDTNVLVYARDASEPERQALARAWLEHRSRLSFWDALIVAGARAAGCRWLLSEDLTPGATYDGVEVVDPFRAPAGSTD